MRNSKNRPTRCFYNLDGALFLKKRFTCACLRCFSLLIVLLESMMQCVVLLFCCVFIIADCRFSKKQASSAGRPLAGGRDRDTERGIHEIFRKRTAGGQTGRLQSFFVLFIYYVIYFVY